MQLSHHDREVLEKLGRALADQDPALARRLGTPRRRPLGTLMALSLSAAGLLLAAGAAVAAAFSTQAPLVGLGCVLIVLGMSVATTCLSVLADSHTPGPPPRSSLHHSPLQT